MFGVKKLDIYIIRQFLALLTVTFFITLFVIVMQFVWLRIDDMLGKGIPIDVMAKFLFYASLSSTPIALPLAILLAALMTFGNLGERLELIAMKTAGISLFRIMRPLITFIVLVAIGSFFYSNYVIPIAQKRMWTLMFSFQDKALEIEVPVGEFYSGIRNVNIYARGKDKKRRAMLDVMIYDFSRGFENASITCADTVMILTTEDKKYLKIVMNNGESFENVQNRQEGSNTIPYRRESFKYKELLFDFYTGFKELDENIMADQHISKNISRLVAGIDSISVVRDSLKAHFYSQLTEETPAYIADGSDYSDTESSSRLLSQKLDHINVDSVVSSATPQETLEVIARRASNLVESKISTVRYNTIIISDADNFFITHNIEWHLKFTLSFACVIFFFIGAPLGAIIGKGGIGLPTVVAIILFILYYIINTMSQKMATEGKWEVWQGMWFSSAILLPIGIWLTYKAAKDTMTIDFDRYKQAIGKLKRLVPSYRRA